jgi:hypothetical protein
MRHPNRSNKSKRKRNGMKWWKCGWGPRMKVKERISKEIGHES